MFCPVCDGVTLREVEKNGVLIDVCPSCKGVWLDRGELDKLMQDVHSAHKEYDQLQAYAYEQRRKSQQPMASYDHYPSSHAPQQQYEPAPRHGYDSHHNQYKKVGYDKYGRPYKYKKKKTVFNMLEDLFD